MGNQQPVFCPAVLRLSVAVIFICPFLVFSAQEDPLQPKLEFVFEVRAKVADPIVVGQVPDGTRRIIDILGGSFEGPKIKGKLLPGGADW